MIDKINDDDKSTIYLSEEMHATLSNNQDMSDFIGCKVSKITVTTNKEGKITQIKFVFTHDEKERWLYIFPSRRDARYEREKVSLSLKLE